MGEVTVKDNSRSVKAQIMAKAKRALTIIGAKAESYAKNRCPVDTGLLRNSITHVVGGETVQPAVYFSDNREKQGTYQGQAPKDNADQITLYVGTNVHYAPYQELGHNTAKGNFVPPNSFLRPAMEDHKDEYLQVLQQDMK